MHLLQEAGDAAAAAAEELAAATSSAADGKPASDGHPASETAHFEAIKEQKSSLENGIAAFNRYMRPLATCLPALSLSQGCPKVTRVCVHRLH